MYNYLSNWSDKTEKLSTEGLESTFFCANQGWLDLENSNIFSADNQINFTGLW